MKHLIMSLITIVVLTSCSRGNPENVTSREAKKFFSSGEAWCLNYDENRTCTAVSRFRSISADSAQQTIYSITSNPSLKFVTPLTVRFTPSGICSLTDESMFRGMLIYRTSDNLAIVTDGDRLINEAERQRAFAVMKDYLNQDFGKEICYRYKVVEERDGAIHRIEEFRFLDDIEQPTNTPYIYKFFTQDSDGIQLRPERSF